MNARLVQNLHSISHVCAQKGAPRIRMFPFIRVLVLLGLATSASSAIIGPRRIHHVAAPPDDTSSDGSWSINRIPNGVRHVMASAASGAAGVTFLSPIEIVRVNMMLNKESFTKSLGSLSAGWFRGNGADVLAASVRIGVTMPAFKMYKQALIRLSGGDEQMPAPRWAAFTAGALAGCTATIICFPLEVVRTRVAAGCDVSGGVAACMLFLAETEGVMSLYGGLTTTLAGVLPFNAIKLSSYDILRGKALEMQARARGEVSFDRNIAGGNSGSRADMSVDADSRKLPAVTTAAIGAAGGVLAATSCFPLEVVRRRQMMGEYAGLSVVGALAALVKSEGIAALASGANLNMVKVALGNSIGFVFYEASKDVLQVDGRDPPWKKAKA